MKKHEYKKIFAALDGTPAQFEVASRAIQAAAINNAELQFGHIVVDTPERLTGGAKADYLDGVRESFEQGLAELLEEARNDERIPKVTVEVASGSVEEALHRQLIDSFEPDLVICGERGLSSVRYVFVGSVSTYLIRHLRCDVLVVKQD